MAVETADYIEFVFKASVMCLRHSAGSMPPGGAIPIRSAVGFNGKVSATVLTMGIPLPTPIIDSMSFPALTLSMTATTSSLQYRITLTAVFALKTSSLPSVKMKQLAFGYRVHRKGKKPPPQPPPPGGGGNPPSTKTGKPPPPGGGGGGGKNKKVIFAAFLLRLPCCVVSFALEGQQGAIY